MDLEISDKKLEAWFLKHKQEMLERLEIIVNMHSFTLDGDDVNLLGSQIITWLKEDGFFVEKIRKEKPLIYDETMDFVEKVGNVFSARTHKKQDGAGIVFLAHLDTVFPKKDFWKFHINIKEGKAYGPGIIDMKGGIIVNMYVARAIKELKLIDIPMTLTFSPDEEIGSPTTMPVLQKELQDTIAAICTEPGYLNGGVTTQRKGAGHLRLYIKGVTAHAGRCFADGSSAILELSHKIIDYNAFVNLAEDETVNVGLISGGTSANTLAPDAKANIHISYKTKARGEKLIKNIQEVTNKTHIKGTEAFLHGGLGLPPMIETEASLKLYEYVKKAGELIQYPVFKEASKGAAESGFCSSVLGIPSICSMGVEGEFLHSKKEYMNLDSLIPRCRLAALTAIQIAKISS